MNVQEGFYLHFRKFLYLGSRGIDLSFDYLSVRSADLQIFNSLAESAAARCGEQNDTLSRKIIAFKERIDYGRSDIPPNREADIHCIISGDIYIAVSDLRSGAVVAHFNAASRLLVLPVDVSTRVRYGRTYLVQVSGCGFCEFLCEGSSIAACREICN